MIRFIEIISSVTKIFPNMKIKINNNKIHLSKIQHLILIISKKCKIISQDIGEILRFLKNQIQGRNKRIIIFHLVIIDFVIILIVKDLNLLNHIKIVFNLNHKKIKNNGLIQINHLIKIMRMITKINHFIRKNLLEYNYNRLL